MTRLLLVRHARPTENWDAAPDAGLDGLGQEQAAGLVGTLGGSHPVPVLTSPLRRARETAAPLAAHWGCTPTVVDAVGEIAAPQVDADARVEWLRRVLAGTWADVDDRLATWRRRLLDTVAAIEQESVLFTHFVAINTVVGAATNDDRVMCCAPAHASVTEIDVDRGVVRLVALGAEVDAPMPLPGGGA